MIKQEITFQTVTPLFTGGVDMKMTEIKPASIMGSLRFWFEVICHFSGKFNDPKYSQTEFNYKKYQDFIKNKPEATDIEICNHLRLFPTARYFGCTGWKSKIGIKKINPSGDEIRLISPNRRIIVVNGKNWYLPERYFEGLFKIVFTTESTEIAENILLPLLNFIQEYGFLGAKNNIGFGRVKIIVPNISSNLSFHIFNDEVLWKNIIHRAGKESDLFNGDQINYFNIDDKVGEFQNNIRNLLNKKSQLRSKEGLRPKRHYYFGSTANDEYFTFKNGVKITVQGPNATKIIPLISENEIGFLGIPGIISMEEVAHE